MRNIMNKIQILSLTIASCCLLIACGSGSKDEKITQPIPVIETCAGQSLDTGASCISIENREAIVYKPDDAIEGIALFLHGAPGSAKKVSKIFDAKTLSISEKLLSVAPEGRNETWGWESLNNASASNIDVDFMLNLLAQIRADNDVTTDKVYVFGYSAGGFMAYKLACHIPEHLTSVVTLAGQFRGEFTACSTLTPVTLHHLHSPQDREVPLSGRSTGAIKSVTDTLAHWLLINGCSDTFTSVEHPKVINESSGSETQVWEGCAKDVRFTSLNNVPHESSYNAEALKQIYSAVFN